MNDLSVVLNKELVKISDWLKANKLSLNILKTNLIAFTRSKVNACDLNVFIDNIKIKQVDSVKFLGVDVDSKLSWKEHISKVEHKLSSAV